MCYGDPYWGRDGYYLAMIEAQMEEEQIKKQIEREQEQMTEELQQKELDELDNKSQQ